MRPLKNNQRLSLAKNLTMWIGARHMGDQRPILSAVFVIEKRQMGSNR